MTERIPPHEFTGRSDRGCAYPGCGLADRAEVHKAEHRGDNGWPIYDALPGEMVGGAIIRLRETFASPFNLRHNDVVLAVPSAVHPNDVEDEARRARQRREEDRAKTTVPLVAGPYHGRVNVSADGPDTILVGPQRVPYVAVSDPDTEERLCYAHLAPAIG